VFDRVARWYIFISELSNLGILAYFIAIWNILRLMVFLVIMYICPRVDILYQQKYGKTGVSTEFRPKFWNKNLSERIFGRTGDP
jgi:hypothetical protein